MLKHLSGILPEKNLLAKNTPFYRCAILTRPSTEDIMRSVCNYPGQNRASLRRAYYSIFPSYIEGYDMHTRSRRFYMVLSIGAALVTMGVKFIGYFLTGSVGLFADAAESVVNLVAALVGFWALTLAARPADEDHAYGHTKSEYFSSGVEGALILVAALVIIVEAIPRLL